APAAGAGGAPAAGAAGRRRPRGDDAVALRRGGRWLRGPQPIEVPATGAHAGLRQGGVYVVTGGTGGIGITVAEDLARRCRARVALLSRTGLPDRAAWDERLRAGGASSREGRAVAAGRRSH